MRRAIGEPEGAKARAWLLDEDAVISNQAALAVGEEAVAELAARFGEEGAYFENAKLIWVMVNSSARHIKRHKSDLQKAISLLQQSEERDPTRTEAQQLLYEILTAYRFKVISATLEPEEMERVDAKLELLSKLDSLSANPQAKFLNVFFD